MSFILGYTFAADNYCPRCITKVLPVGEGEIFDGWDLAKGVRWDVEHNLDEIALAFGIDRSNEHSFDSAEFPKVITRQMLQADSLDYPSYCGYCGSALLDD